jgi:hypothetical protein
MRQAIVTKFHGPTNVRGSRVSARAEAGKITLSWDHALNSDQNHITAAEALVEKLGWSGHWVGGSIPGTSGYVFVQDDGDGFAIE